LRLKVRCPSVLADLKPHCCMTLLKNSLFKNCLFGAFSKVLFATKAKTRLKKKTKTLIDLLGHLRVKSSNANFGWRGCRKDGLSHCKVLFEGVFGRVASNAACGEWQQLYQPTSLPSQPVRLFRCKLISEMVVRSALMQQSGKV
jgi:hypothetical protein